MSITAKVRKVMADKDVRSFLSYTFSHPSTYKNRYSKSDLPKYLKEYAFLDIKPEKGQGLQPLEIPKLAPSQSYVFSNMQWNIHLAGVDDDFDLEQMDWDRTYDDPEDVAALHRFIWLYRTVFENLAEDNCMECHEAIKKLIRSWMKWIANKSESEVHSEVWQTYSVSERISNWCLLLAATSRDVVLDEDIIASIINQLNYIQRHFEYFGEEFTGNHFCNDARALYIAGRLLQIDYYQELGRMIIEREFRRVVPDDVFLREGSVHYQFLYTKWFCECLWVTKSTGDTAFAAELEVFLHGLLKGCNYFLVSSKDGWHIPLVGDISPDYEPSWLIGVPWAAQAILDGTTSANPPLQKGFHTFWISGVPQSTTMRCALRGGTDWGKIQQGDFTVFAHVNHYMHPNNLTGHFHHDSGSVQVYVDGNPLLIDCGRQNYSLGHEALRGRNYTGHNVLILDEKNPEIDMRSFYTPDFLEWYVERSPELSESGNQMEMVTYGNRRAIYLEQHSRSVEVQSNVVNITDMLTGNGQHEAQLLFHIPKHYQVEKTGDKIRIQSSQFSCQLTIGWNDATITIYEPGQDETYGHCSKSYGDMDVCYTVVAKGMVDLPSIIHTQLTIINQK